MVTVQPGGIDSSDEELGAVAIRLLVDSEYDRDCFRFGENARVATSVGHGQEAGLGVLVEEVLVVEFSIIDGLAAGALKILSVELQPGSKYGTIRCDW